jgi:hypothetical protein
MKVCTKCKQEKELDCFGSAGPSSRAKNGLTSICKPCLALQKKAWTAKNKDKVKAINRKQTLKNITGRLSKIQQWHLDNPERAKAAAKKWRQGARAKETARRWVTNNPEAAKAIHQRYVAKKRLVPKSKLTDNFRRRINQSLHNGLKARRHLEDLIGYTIDQLVQHIEKQFTNGMSWDNYGTYWHIDHKIPIAVFNYGKPEDIDFRICWSLKNLQPLEATENRKKKDKIDKPFQPSLLLRVLNG